MFTCNMVQLYVQYSKKTTKGYLFKTIFMETTVNQRIKILIKELENGRQVDFSRKTDILTATLNKIIGPRASEPGYGILNKILNTYSQVNPTWLIKGEGDMLLNDVEKQKQNKALDELVAVAAEQSKQIEKLVNIISELVSSGQRSKLLGNLNNVGVFPLPMAA
jgi:hypothetical protein